MRLKRLELYGFKSFADRTVFEFGDHTLTGVVGPNGCGKSNVVDSVRWVLGEQRPTSMRGAEMTDVIFKGSSSRPPLSVAEVTLVLDNAPVFPAERPEARSADPREARPDARAEFQIAARGAEIAITRRVFQSGEGEYLIDGEGVRLKDVREMLYDTGLGSRGYSVLEQGRIDAVLSANPLERRRVFEEAAGISRYRQRKVEAELRLKKVAEDGARLADLLGELSTRVRSLKIQAGKAERFVLAREEWSREKAKLYRHRLGHFGRELEALSGEIAHLDEGRANSQRERAGRDERAASLEREREVRAAEIGRLAAESSRLAGEGRALDERRAQLSARAAGLERDAREEGERAARLKASLDERATEVAQVLRELAEVEAEVVRSSMAEEESRGGLEAAERAELSGRAEAERLRSESLAAFGGLNQAENEMRSLGEAAGLSRARAERAQAKLAGALEARDALESDAAALALRARESESAHAASDENRRSLEQGLEESARAIRELDLQRGALDVDRARIQGRIESLLDRERDLEELSEAARAVLEQAGGEPGDENVPCVPEDLLGLAADHLRTDTLHARALDAALAVRGRAIVARDRAAAARIAGWLKQRERGSVGLLLSAGLAASPRKAAPAPQGADGALVSGRLVDRVRCTAGCEPLLEILIGDVYVARDLEAALALAERHPALRFTTLEGDLADAAGLLACGGALTLGPVGRRSSAAELAGEVARLSQEIAGLDERRADLAARERSLEDDLRRSAERLDLAAAARADAESRLSTARARLSDLDEDRAALARESASAAAEVEGLERDLAAAQGAAAKARESHAGAQAALSAAEIRASELASARERAAAAEAEARVDAARARERREGLARRRGDLEAVLLENRAEMERAQKLSREQAEAGRKSQSEAEATAVEIARLLEERAKQDELLASARERDEHERDAVQEERARAEALQRELDLSAAALSEKRLSEQRLALAREEILRRAAEELALDEAALAAGFAPDEELAASADLDALEASVQELKDRLEKLGPVNMEAMAELTEVGSRLEFLEKQRDDLTRAREALTSTLRTIDAESKRLFLETFETVRANFQRIFRQLFGGGRADVSLEEGVDVLDAGVEIVARPPGRELLPIGLLSGGQRTLTALALLFAVFEARPSPFCILDEVDAALDDANVERFLALLEGFRRSTQFVIVTHNKGTMAACQGLYGVTMETKGVSRQVAVELEEAERWTAGAIRERENGAGQNGKGAGPEPRDVAFDPETGEPLVEILPRAASQEPLEAPSTGNPGPSPLRASPRGARSRGKDSGSRAIPAVDPTSEGTSP